MQLHCVDDRVPHETIHLLEAACRARGVTFTAIDACAVDPTRVQPLAPGEMLYRPAVSIAAIRLEQLLAGDGVVTFHPDREAMFFSPLSAPLLFERAGLPVPRTVPCASADRAILRRCVDHLGGLPVVVKVAGGEGGVGVMLAESLASLYALVDHLLDSGRQPWLTAFVADAMHWRVVVVGDDAVAAYRNPVEPGDFRSVASADPADVFATVAEPLAALAVAAVRTLRVETGGVDILEHPGGRLYLLEANFPCYFAHAQRIAGIDVAGRMVDHLLAKRHRDPGKTVTECV
jgi:glutathione synthase/RimK-type ligase-like ATP-grasp enzyme